MDGLETCGTLNDNDVRISKMDLSMKRSLLYNLHIGLINLGDFNDAGENNVGDLSHLAIALPKIDGNTRTMD